VACLFCGKDIGPIRLLRDSEFCSPKHRKEYKDRLQKVLVRVGEPETVPTNVAPFQEMLRANPGVLRKSEAAFDFSSRKNSARLPQWWTLEIPGAGGNLFARFDLNACEMKSQPRLAHHPEAISYFGKSAAGLLALPQPKLGTVVLRTADGELLSGPIALQCRVAGPPSVQPNIPAPLVKAAEPSLAALELPAAVCHEMAAPAEPAPSETWMSTPAPEPATPAVNERSCNEPIAAEVDIHVPVTLPEPANKPMPILDEFVTPPLPSEAWMRRPVVEPADYPAARVSAEALPLAGSLRLPNALSVAPAMPKPEFHAALLAGALPRPAPMEARHAIPPVVPFAAAPATPKWNGLELPRPELPAPDARYLAAPNSEPAVCDVHPAAAAAPVAFAAGAVRYTPLAIAPVNDLLELLVEQTPAPEAPLGDVPHAARAAAPPTPSRAKSAPSPVERPAAGSPSRTPAVMPAAAGRPQTEVPQAGLFALEYHSPAGPAAPRPDLDWVSRTASLKLPRFAVRPVFDRLEDQSAPKPERKRPAFAEIFTMPDAAAIAKRKAARHAFTAIAASITVAMALWFGANAGKFGKDLMDREAARAQSAASSIETAASRAAQPEPSALSHPVAWVRTAAAKRATVQLSDTFENGMSAWGAKGTSLAAGWSHSRDGYVRPGPLALYQPSLNFTDYRMDFFGQIENRSMSWVVRGKDPQNYYAMKFNILEPGLRPVISMTHYPVVGGKQGHKVETPLSVMVHNNMPYHVSVEVKGSHYTASIEGQEVDSWSDDTLLAGGVGFFSEAGARARIYWMKVSKNDDWLGRLCGRIAGEIESHESARLDRPALPAPQPQNPAPGPATAALWPAETAGTWNGKLQREGGSWKGEIETWSS